MEVIRIRKVIRKSVKNERNYKRSGKWGGDRESQDLIIIRSIDGAREIGERKVRNIESR